MSFRDSSGFGCGVSERHDSAREGPYKTDPDCSAGMLQP